jgi:hypothetical protein
MGNPPGARNVAADILLHQKIGVHLTINAGGNVDALLSAARTLAAAHALLAMEGSNEPNNFAITGGTSPNQTKTDAASVQLTLSDHAMIVEIGN